MCFWFGLEILRLVNKKVFFEILNGLYLSGPVLAIFPSDHDHFEQNLKVEVIRNWEFKSLWIQREKS